MVLASALIAAAYFSIFALGALPVPGAPYRIHNVQTGLVFDNEDALPVAGNPINAVPPHTSSGGPSGPPAQRISVKQDGIVLGTTAGLFEFLFPMTGVGVFAKGLPVAGLALNAQNFSTQLQVTEVSAGVYTIVFPFSNLAVTSPTVNVTPITFQPLRANSALQQWRFIPFP